MENDNFFRVSCIRRGFFLNRTFRAVDDFNAQFDKRRGEIANPCVRATPDRILDEVFAEEHSALIALPGQQRERGQAAPQPIRRTPCPTQWDRRRVTTGPPANAVQPQRNWNRVKCA